MASSRTTEWSSSVYLAGIDALHDSSLRRAGTRNWRSCSEAARSSVETGCGAVPLTWRASSAQAALDRPTETQSVGSAGRLFRWVYRSREGPRKWAAGRCYERSELTSAGPSQRLSMIPRIVSASAAP